MRCRVCVWCAFVLLLQLQLLLVARTHSWSANQKCSLQTSHSNGNCLTSEPHSLLKMSSPLQMPLSSLLQNQRIVSCNTQKHTRTLGSFKQPAAAAANTKNRAQRTERIGSRANRNDIDNKSIKESVCTALASVQQCFSLSLSLLLPAQQVVCSAVQHSTV